MLSKRHLVIRTNHVDGVIPAKAGIHSAFLQNSCQGKVDPRLRGDDTICSDNMIRQHINAGFTLLEILIALFVFTILSLILVSALHNVINLQSGTEKNAERLRQLQIALLLMSRDIEQAVNRPALNSSGQEEPAFVGKTASFTLTHAGFANPTGSVTRSTLQRTAYVVDGSTLYRETWDQVDQAPQSKPHLRPLLENVATRFEYLNKEGHFLSDWPAEGQGDKEPLPRAIRIYLSIPQWGDMSQLYVITAQPTKPMPAPPPTPPKQPA